MASVQTSSIPLCVFLLPARLDSSAPPIVRELIERDTRFVLAGSDAATAFLAAAGADIHRGSLDDLDSLRGGAAASNAAPTRPGSVRKTRRLRLRARPMCAPPRKSDGVGEQPAAERVPASHACASLRRDGDHGFVPALSTGADRIESVKSVI
jgi:hypothetical protein